MENESSANNAVKKPAIQLTFRIADGNERKVKMNVKPNTKFGKMFVKLAESLSVDGSTFRFLFDGNRINEMDTPESIEVEDGDMIDVVMEQQGGFRYFIFRS
uniref:Ubiquitin-like domain-containing protein n=1 Tax=Aplanochytrium stocchinoi TaxID=215587 RepID=A0A7S3UZ61_9STRA|mmetsp:Transcript_9849/g.11322  ORF Transcript_9849/g.11322 Transcript_9849/m.11322 type:complete len:102 (+) Transcript_9849:188-493(+)